MKETVDHCASGNRWQRMGVAKTLADVVGKLQPDQAMLARLRNLFEDPDGEVRDTASWIFRDSALFDHDFAVELVEAFLQSPALDNNIDDLLRGLEAFPKPLRPFGSALCRLADRFAGPLAAEARDYRTARPFDAGLLAKILLRLYEQTEDNRVLRRACLDSWDRLLRRGLGYGVLQEIDGHTT